MILKYDLNRMCEKNVFNLTVHPDQLALHNAIFLSGELREVLMKHFKGFTHSVTSSSSQAKDTYLKDNKRVEVIFRQSPSLEFNVAIEGFHETHALVRALKKHHEQLHAGF